MLDQNSGNIVINTGTIQGGITQTQGAVEHADVTAADGGHNREKKYDVALSYAGEQVAFVSRVSKLLEAEGLTVFFAPKREEEFAAEDMIVRFYQIYRYESRYVASFVTKDYLKKDITMHEASTAMLRAREEGHNCLIPIYFEGARLEHLDPDIHYICADGLLAVEVADKIKTIVQCART